MFDSPPTPTTLFNKLRNSSDKMQVPADAKIYFEGSKRFCYTQDALSLDWPQFTRAAGGFYIAQLDVITPNTSPEKQPKQVLPSDPGLVAAVNGVRKLYGT